GAGAGATRPPAAPAGVRPRRAGGGGPPPTAWTLSKEPDARWLDEPLLRRFRSVIEAGLYAGLPGIRIARTFGGRTSRRPLTARPLQGKIGTALLEVAACAC